MLGMDARMLSLLWAALPPSVHMHTWSLCFRLSDHGASLRTLYQKVAERPDVTETVLLVRDTNGYVFGALAMKPGAEATRHYGGGEMMVFKCGRATDVEGRQSARSSISGSPSSVRRGAQFRRFGRTGKNDLFQLARPDSLCVGGGGQGYPILGDATALTACLPRSRPVPLRYGAGWHSGFIAVDGVEFQDQRLAHCVGEREQRNLGGRSKR